MNVADINFRFKFLLVLPHLDIHNLIYDQNTTHGSTRSCTLPMLRKTNFSTHFHSELGLSVFVIVVDMDVKFH